MSDYAMSTDVLHPRKSFLSEYRQVLMLVTSALLLSTGTILFYNYKMYDELAAEAYNMLELAAITAMPYMISAVVATITTIAVMSALPAVRTQQATQQIYRRVKRLADGDLTTTSRLDSSNPAFKDIAGELNYAIGFIGSSVAQWKIINRQQWDLLENVRIAAVKQDYVRALRMIEKMEDNWKMTASIENRFRT